MVADEQDEVPAQDQAAEPLPPPKSLDKKSKKQAPPPPAPKGLSAADIEKGFKEFSDELEGAEGVDPAYVNKALYFLGEAKKQLIKGLKK